MTIGRRRLPRAEGKGPSLTTGEEPAPSAPRTDLAVEAYEQIRQGAGAGELAGVEVETEQRHGVTVRRVRVSNPQAAARMAKAPGLYVTVESAAFWERSAPQREALTQAVARELGAMLAGQQVGREDPVLVAGLGNWNATPDSLGPRVVGQLLVTRHLRDWLPPEKRGALRPVAALSPGVLGLTGIETTELVAAVVDRIRPRAVICVDALAAAGVDRLCSTVQLADTGIDPGAGVGNRRKGLNRQVLGVPVIAMGVPTVIHARRLSAAPWAVGMEAGPALGAFPELLRGAGGPPDGPGRVGTHPGAGPGPTVRPGIDLAQLIVTPKEIDVLVEEAAEVLAAALNGALHEGVDLEETLQYLQ